MSVADDLIQSIECLEKYGNVEFAAEHDILYMGVTFDSVVSEADKEFLAERNFMVDESDNWFSRFI